MKGCSIWLIIHEKQIKTMLNNSMNISLFKGVCFHFSSVYIPRNKIYSS